MSKECRDCEFFNGYDYSDGTPKCDYEDGYECCPYNNYANTKKTGFKVEIDTEFVSNYIRHTISNTMVDVTSNIVRSEIRSIVDENVKKKILREIDEQIESVVADAISEFMEKEITVGGGWSAPERTLTRTEYLGEMIEKELSKQFKEDALKSYAASQVKTEIEIYTRKLKDQINAGIKTNFDAATRQILTDNVVSMLMCNDTYQKLSTSMQTFLPQN